MSREPHNIDDVCSRLDDTNALLVEIRDMLKLATQQPKIAKCVDCGNTVGEYFMCGPKKEVYCSEACYLHGLRSGT